MPELSHRELELRHYWSAMQNAGRVFPEFDSRDELELLFEMSDWPRLRKAAQSNLGRFDFNARRVAKYR